MARCYQFQLNLTRGAVCHQENLKNCSHHSNADLYFTTGVDDVSTKEPCSCQVSTSKLFPIILGISLTFFAQKSIQKH